MKKNYVNKAERICKQIIINDNTTELENAINAGMILSCVRVERFTPLEYAVLIKSNNIVKWMVQNCKELMSANELVFACGSDNSEAMDILIAANDDINRQGYAGSALSISVQEGRIDFVRKLLSYNADVWCFNEYTLAPIYIAAAEGYDEIVDVLLNHIEFADSRNLSWDKKCVLAESLVIAGVNGNLSIVQAMVDWGMDINSCDSDGRSLLFYALTYENHELLSYLYEKNCIIDMFDAYGISTKRMICDNSYRKYVKNAVLNGTL